MNYVDGFVIAVPTAKKQEYIEFCQFVGPMFKEYGVLKMVECWGDEVPEGELTSFPMAVKCQEDETVVFSWLIWPSKEVRDEAMEKIKHDERMHPKDKPIPFDGKRMIFGGFIPIYDV